MTGLLDTAKMHTDCFESMGQWGKSDHLAAVKTRVERTRAVKERAVLQAERDALKGSREPNVSKFKGRLTRKINKLSLHIVGLDAMLENNPPEPLHPSTAMDYLFSWVDGWTEQYADEAKKLATVLQANPWAAESLLSVHVYKLWKMHVYAKHAQRVFDDTAREFEGEFGAQEDSDLYFETLQAMAVQYNRIVHELLDYEVHQSSSPYHNAQIIASHAAKQYLMRTWGNALEMQYEIGKQVLAWLEVHKEDADGE